MKHLKIHFYVGTPTPLIPKVLNKIINIFTNSPISHVELELDGMSYSAEFFKNKVRKKYISYGNSNWKSHTIPVTDREYSMISSELERHIGKPYDLFGILARAIFKTSMNFENKFFCSEYVAQGIRVAWPDLFKKTNSYYNPAQLYKLLKNNGVI